MAHIRQSEPDHVLGFQDKVLETSQGVPSLLGSGRPPIVLVHRMDVSRWNDHPFGTTVHPGGNPGAHL